MFSLLIVPIGEDRVVRVTGAFTRARVVDFENCIADVLGEQPRQLIVELSSVDAIDSAAISALGVARDAAGAVGIRFFVDAPSDVAREQLPPASFIVR
jgi:anti-anti-sigma regulatory factor